jgi:hypothetical protein
MKRITMMLALAALLVVALSLSALTASAEPRGCAGDDPLPSCTERQTGTGSPGQGQGEEPFNEQTSKPGQGGGEATGNPNKTVTCENRGGQDKDPAKFCA